MFLNKAQIIGNLTRDPELKSLPSGIAVTTFSVATNRYWKDQSGERKQDTQYHNVVVFGRQAETTAQYLRKGQTAYVEGRIQTRSWDGDDGQKRYRTEIVADTVQFGPKAGGGGAQPSQNSSTNAKPAETKSTAAVDTIEYPDDEISPEDIPF